MAAAASNVQARTPRLRATCIVTVLLLITFSATSLLVRGPSFRSAPSDVSAAYAVLTAAAAGAAAAAAAERATSSVDEGCLAFCSPRACPVRKAGSGLAADACVVRGAVLVDGTTMLSFVGREPPDLQSPPAPFQYQFVPDALVSQPCLVPGTTLLIVNYQQHIPHFAEGLFFALTGLLSMNSTILCGEEESACRLLFHQIEQWPERTSIAWHTDALDVAAAAVPRALAVLNPDLYNVAGASRSSEILPGCGSGSLAFERLVLLHPRYERRWFTEPSACAAFRKAALGLHVPGANSNLATHVIALLLRRGSRNIVNSEAVEAAMRKRFAENVRLLTFEGLTFAEQVKALHDVKLLVAPHGAGLTNIAFMPPGAALIEVFPIYYRPGEYFDALARGCGMWYGAYENTDVNSAVLDEQCHSEFGGRLPTAGNCSRPERCAHCGKQSATRVSIERLDALLIKAQAHLDAAL